MLWSDLTPACSDHSQDLGSWELPKAFARVYDHASTINNQSINLKSRVTESLDVFIACHCWRFTETSYGHFWDRDCAIGHSCETGSSLSVLSELGHLCLVFFLQTTHSGNLFAAFVTLLRKPNETHHKLEKISRSACQKWILSGLRCMSLSGNLEK